MSAPRKIWIRVTDGSLMPERPSDADEHDNLYHHDDAVRDLVEALEEQVAFHAMDLAMRRRFLEKFEIDDIEYRRDRARAALAKIAQEDRG